jgi:hypothetical protein
MIQQPAVIHTLSVSQTESPMWLHYDRVFTSIVANLGIFVAEYSKLLLNDAVSYRSFKNIFGGGYNVFVRDVFLLPFRQSARKAR